MALKDEELHQYPFSSSSYLTRTTKDALTASSGTASGVICYFIRRTHPRTKYNFSSQFCPTF